MSASKSLLVILVLVVVAVASCQAKLRRSRYFDEGYDSAPYASGSTGERAILTVRGTRNPYDGSAPSKIAIEDNPYRGPYPRGVYDRLDGYSRGRYPGGSMRFDPYGYNQGPYGNQYGG